MDQPSGNTGIFDTGSAIIPELLIQKVIIAGLQGIKKDPRLLDVLFRNASQALLSSIKDYVVNKNIDFSMNYPKKGQLNVPAIVLLLKGESEAETFLGDFTGIVTSSDMEIYQGNSAVNSQSYLALRVSVEGSSGNTVYIAENSLDSYVDWYSSVVDGIGSYIVRVVAGTGKGQEKEIVSVSSLSIDIDSPFMVNLGIDSILEIRSPETVTTEGEPSKVFDLDSSSYERIGVHYDTQYQLQILADHQDGVIYLYSIVKALLLSQRPFLEGQGVFVLKLSGSDFAPRGEYLPDNIFMRILTLQFTYPFSFYRELETVNTIALDLQIDPMGLPGTGNKITIGSFAVD